jgi:hypothetical protein
VKGKTREGAWREVQLLAQPDASGHAEPRAKVVERRVCTWVGAAGYLVDEALDGEQP